MFDRIKTIIRTEGKWSLYLIPEMLVNRINIAFQRYCLDSNDVYFQGTPKIRGRTGILFGKNFRCGKGAWIETISKSGHDRVLLTIGDNVTASENLHLAAVNGVVIGDNVLLGSNVLIIDHDHGYYGANLPDSPALPPNERRVHSKGPVSIGKNVWIGDGVKILSNVNVGNGAVIGANTVVTRDVPAGAIVGSSGPVRTIKVWDSELKLWK
jgi:acetyltransferase-like isoleucine patch superfamily enzyme